MTCDKCGYLHDCYHQCMNLPEGKTCADCMHIKKCVLLFHGNPENRSCGFEPIRFKIK